MTWTTYGNLHQLILPHGRIEVSKVVTDDDAHRWCVEIHTDGNVRWFEYSGYLWQAQRAAYSDLHRHYERTRENLSAMYETLKTGSRSPAPEVGA